MALLAAGPVACSTSSPPTSCARIAWSLLVANAHCPTRNPLLLVLSFFGGGSCPRPPAGAGVVVLRTCAGCRTVPASVRPGPTRSASRQRRRARRGQPHPGGAVPTSSTTRRSAPIPEDELADRPSASGSAALLPLLNGNRRRRKTRDVVFSEPAPGERGPRLKLDVYLPLQDPEPGEKRPAVLQIHGGAWVLGSKNEQGIPLLNHLASCGWVGFNVDYRLSPRSRAPQHLVDCKRALAWIREHGRVRRRPDFVSTAVAGHLRHDGARPERPAAPAGLRTPTCRCRAVPFYGCTTSPDQPLRRVVSAHLHRPLARVVMRSASTRTPSTGPRIAAGLHPPGRRPCS